MGLRKEEMTEEQLELRRAGSRKGTASLKARSRRRAWAVRTLREAGWRMVHIAQAMELSSSTVYALLRSIETETECPGEYLEEEGNT